MHKDINLLHSKLKDAAIIYSKNTKDKNVQTEGKINQERTVVFRGVSTVIFK